MLLLAAIGAIGLLGGLATAAATEQSPEIDVAEAFNQAALEHGYAVRFLRPCIKKKLPDIVAVVGMHWESLLSRMNYAIAPHADGTTTLLVIGVRPMGEVTQAAAPDNKAVPKPSSTPTVGRVELEVDGVTEVVYLPDPDTLIRDDEVMLVDLDGNEEWVVVEAEAVNGLAEDAEYQVRYLDDGSEEWIRVDQSRSEAPASEIAYQFNLLEDGVEEWIAVPTRPEKLAIPETAQRLFGPDGIEEWIIRE
jgi:hypothetical protein